MSNLPTVLRAALVVIGFSSALVSPALQAQVISSHTTGGDVASVFPGQRVTTPDGGPWNNIRFNWFSSPNLQRASGELFILSQEYLGLPASLSDATPGFLARSTEIARLGPSLEQSEYLFAPDFMLLPGTTYWFFTNVNFETYASAGSYPQNDGGAYYEGSDGDAFLSRPMTRLNYTLQGVPVGAEVPEPQTLTMLVAGLFALGLAARRTR